MGQVGLFMCLHVFTCDFDEFFSVTWRSERRTEEGERVRKTRVIEKDQNTEVERETG